MFEERSTVKVLPWFVVRKLIWDVWADRIEHEEEMTGHVSQCYIPLEEFTCLYFLKTYNLRRLAESKLMEFVASLKFFSRTWSRANIFSRLCCMMSPLSNGNQLENSLTNDYDIYTQHYFFWFLKIVLKARRASPDIIFEGNDGVTWLTKRSTMHMGKEILFFLPQTYFFKFEQKMLRE